MVEALQRRLFLYALDDGSWRDLDPSTPAIEVTYSIMPDGTPMGDRRNALHAHMDAQHPREVWLGQIDRAFAEWAAHSPLRFTRVSDDGSPQGVSGAAQGDPRFGDIRIGAIDVEVLAFAWYVSGTTRGGDITFSTRYDFEIGTPFDLFSLALHESGHSLGLRHSNDITAVMSTTSTRVLTGLTPDDIAGINAKYQYTVVPPPNPDPEPDPDPEQPPVPPPPPPPTKPGKGGGKGKLMALFSNTRVSVLERDPESVLV
jgi:hypothetical protein